CPAIAPPFFSSSTYSTRTTTVLRSGCKSAASTTKCYSLPFSAADLSLGALGSLVTFLACWAVAMADVEHVPQTSLGLKLCNWSLLMLSHSGTTPRPHLAASTASSPLNCPQFLRRPNYQTCSRLRLPSTTSTSTGEAYSLPSRAEHDRVFAAARTCFHR
ncbi:hypothetical protein C8R45DRAFT_1176429, partial [Mycena sanguinolenta]